MLQCQVSALVRKWYGEDAQVIDLTDNESRHDAVKLLQEEGERSSVVLTVGMMKEGADWPQGVRTIIAKIGKVG